MLEEEEKDPSKNLDSKEEFRWPPALLKFLNMPKKCLIYMSSKRMLVDNWPMNETNKHEIKPANNQKEEM